MRKAKNLLRGKRFRLGVMALVMVLTFGFAFEQASFVSHAESKGKIIGADSVNIRESASTGSAKVGSAQRDAAVDIRGKTTASDGTVWYQVFVDADTLGYIRSDYVQITDGTTPPTVEATTGSQTATQTTTTTNANETPADVTAVEPLSATVTNGQKVRVRSNASTTSSIVTSVQSGLALTVTGQATGADGKTWYQVEFIANGSNVTGFIRSDYVALSGELVPVTETVEPEAPAQQETPVPQEAPEVTKKWDTQLQGDKWYLLNMETGKQYTIDDLFNAVQTNAELYEDSQKTVGSQKVAIIILVILLIVFGSAAALLFLKIKDMTDSAYFSQVEKETLRRRGDAKPQSNQKVVHTVGPEKKQGNRPQGAKPQGAQPQGAQPQGARPQGARPQGAQPQGARPQGARPQGAQPQGTRPQGARPQGAQPQGTRPQGARPQGAQPQGIRPQGARPQGAQPQGTRPQGARPQGAQPQAARPQSAQPQGTRPQGAQPQAARPTDAAKPANAQQNPGWKSKNFMTDDDEFEFEFLNWDGEEE